MPEKNPYFASTFAERKAIREAAEKIGKSDEKAVESGEAENKAVAPKRTTRKKA